MKTINIKCLSCGTSLTNQLKRFDLNLEYLDTGEEIIERGHFIEGDIDISIAHHDRILINVRDSKLVNHKLLKNCFGCCGYSDTDFLNQICPSCDQGIATIVTECYTYHYLAFQKGKIIIEEI